MAVGEVRLWSSEGRGNIDCDARFEVRRLDVELLDPVLVSDGRPSLVLDVSDTAVAGRGGVGRGAVVAGCGGVGRF